MYVLTSVFCTLHICLFLTQSSKTNSCSIEKTSCFYQCKNCKFTVLFQLFAFPYMSYLFFMFSFLHFYMWLFAVSYNLPFFIPNIYFKGSLTRGFRLQGFFHESVFPRPPSIPLEPFWIFSKIRGDIRELMFITGVTDTGDKLFSGVNDTGEKCIAGVIDTSD